MINSKVLVLVLVVIITAFISILAIMILFIQNVDPLFVGLSIAAIIFFGAFLIHRSVRG